MSWFWYLLLFGVCAALAVAVPGVLALRIRKPVPATVLEGISHGVGCLVLFLGMNLVIPKYKAIFADFGVELPVAVMLVIRVSDWFVSYSYLLAPFLLTLLMADFALFYVLGSTRVGSVDRNRAIRNGCSGIITGVMVTVILVGMVVVLGPLSKLEQSLS